MTEEQSDAIAEQVIGSMLSAFSQFPLNENHVKASTLDYIAKLNAAMDIKTKLVEDDGGHPVVEVSACVIDQQATAEMAKNNENLIALSITLGQLRAQGITDEQIKEDEYFQQAVVECITDYVNEIPLKNEQTIRVVCNLARGDDGKLYWAPADPGSLGEFLNDMEGWAAQENLTI